MEISSSISQENSIQERQSIISQASARGLQLSEDGHSWVPINTESRNLPFDQNNAIIVKNEQLDNSQAATVTILYLFCALVAILGVIFVIYVAINIFFYFLWAIGYVLGGGTDDFTPIYPW